MKVRLNSYARDWRMWNTDDGVVVSCPGWYFRLCPSSGEAVLDAELCAYVHRTDLDEVVHHHPSQELPVSRLPNRRKVPMANTSTPSLAAVNFFLALVGITQLTRIAMHESSKKSGDQIVEDVKADVQGRVDGAKETAEIAKEKIQQAKP